MVCNFALISQLNQLQWKDKLEGITEKKCINVIMPGKKKEKNGTFIKNPGVDKGFARNKRKKKKDIKGKNFACSWQ